MFLYALTILVSAFLLFQVQPVIARAILPWFGGSAAVWTTCLLFFQSVLLLGYLYAHWLYARLRPRWQMMSHLVLLAVSLLALPIAPSASWKPAGDQDPTLRILLLLAANVGLPYFLLSTTGPLLQAWYARQYKGAIPYRLYALSNLGSMLALVSYPFLFEPWLGTHRQTLGWSWAYGVFVLLCAATALRAGGNTAPLPAETGPPPPASDKFFWIALPACASVLLLAVTNHLTQNVAAIPFLWILPLSLYLLSFILCFDNAWWYKRSVFLGLFAVAVGTMAYALSPEFQNNPIKIMIPFFAAGLFVCCMVCHGELARLKPDPSRLTAFYVAIALGGAMGGVLVALIAPRVFSGFFELPLGLMACAVVVFAVLRRDPASGLGGSWRRPFPLGAAVLILAVIGYLAFIVHGRASGARLLVRNFYGGLKIIDAMSDDDQSTEPVRRLLHGTITHGEQYLIARKRDFPTTYYGANSGIGRAIRQCQDAGPVRVGVIGLGTGTLAAYGRPGDYFRFYEINPLVLKLANTEFTFLKDCPARKDVALGDARLSLERESPENFDVLAVDAFSGDAIPVHLLTREAFELYFRHLKPDGVLAVHVSNKYLDLTPVVKLGAVALGKEARLIDTEDEANDVFGATWMLVTANREFFDKPLLRTAATAVPRSDRVRLWTDDYSNLFRILN